MGFRQAAEAICDWAQSNPMTFCALALTAALAPLSKRAYDAFIGPIFVKPTPTFDDNPAIRASRERSDELMRKLGISTPKGP